MITKGACVPGETRGASFRHAPAVSRDSSGSFQAWRRSKLWKASQVYKVLSSLPGNSAAQLEFGLDLLGCRRTRRPRKQHATPPKTGGLKQPSGARSKNPTVIKIRKSRQPSTPGLSGKHDLKGLLRVWSLRRRVQPTILPAANNPVHVQIFLDLASTVSCCGSPARDCTGRRK